MINGEDITIVVWFYPDEEDLFLEDGKSVHLSVSNKSYKSLIGNLCELTNERQIDISLHPLPGGSPSHLDDPSEIITNAVPVSFEQITIKCANAAPSQIHMSMNEKHISFIFTKDDLLLLGNLLKRAIEEYGSLHDNFMEVESFQDKCKIFHSELVIWGFHIDKPIYY